MPFHFFGHMEKLETRNRMGMCDNNVLVRGVYVDNLDKLN